MGKGAQVTDASQEREEQAMAKVVDVAAYVLQERGPMTAWKLQKLVYYCQAWSLVWDETALFEEPIEAWANGPVVRALYDLHKGEFQLKHLWNEDGEKVGEPDALTHVERETVDLVLRDYSDRSGQWLSELTHMERPWRAARARDHALPGDLCEEVIRHDEIADYYGGLLAAENARMGGAHAP